MSYRAMENALDQSVYGRGDGSEKSAFRAGWNAAMRFMAQPRMPGLTPTPIQPEPNPIAQRFVGETKGIAFIDWRGHTTTVPVTHLDPDEIAQRFVEDPQQPKEYNCPPGGIPLEPEIPGPDTTLTSTPVHKEPDPVAERYVGDEPPVTWTEADRETMRRICEEYGRDIEVASECTFVEDPSRPGFLRRCHNPHGLVAFYTDAP